jgi:hypothetical protein
MRNPILKRLGLEELDAYVPSATASATIPEPVVETTVTDLPVVVATDDGVTVVEVPVAVVTVDGVVEQVAAASEDAAAKIEESEPVPAVDPETEAVVVVVSTENDTLLPGNTIAPDASLTEAGSATATASTTPVVEFQPVAADLPIEDAPLIPAPVLEPTVAEDIPAVMVDTDIEYVEVVSEVEASSDSVDGLLATALALEEIAGLEPELLTNPEEIAVAEIAIATATATLNDDEFSETVSIETLSAKVKEVWVAVIAAIKAFFEKLAKYFKSLITKNAENRRKVTAAIAEAKASKGSVKVVKGPAHAIEVNDGIVVVTAPSTAAGFGSAVNAGVEFNLGKFEGWVKHHEDTIASLTKLLSKVKSTKADDVADTVKAFRSFGEAVDTLTIDPVAKDVPVFNDNGLTTTVQANSISDVLSHLGKNVDSAGKIADKFESIYEREQKLLDEIILATAEIENSELGAAVRTHVLTKVNRLVSLTSSYFNQVQRELNGQVGVAATVAKKLAALATK